VCSVSADADSPRKKSEARVVKKPGVARTPRLRPQTLSNAISKGFSRRGAGTQQMAALLLLNPRSSLDIRGRPFGLQTLRVGSPGARRAAGPMKSASSAAAAAALAPSSERQPPGTTAGLFVGQAVSVPVKGRIFLDEVGPDRYVLTDVVTQRTAKLPPGDYELVSTEDSDELLVA